MAGAIVGNRFRGVARRLFDEWLKMLAPLKEMGKRVCGKRLRSCW